VVIKNTKKIPTMKFSLKPLAYIGMATILFTTSCGKDDDDDKNGSSVNEEKSVEVQKEDIEKYSVDVVSELQAMKESEEMQTLMTFVELFSSMSSNASPGLSVASIAEAINTGDAQTGLKAMKEESISITGMFDEAKGVYTWDPTTENFDKSGESSSIVYKFPSTEGGQSNDAEITIEKPTTGTITVDGASQEIPTNVSVNLSKDSKEVVSISLKSTIADNFISSATFAVSMGKYELSTSIGYTASKMSESIAFTASEQTIIKFEYSIEGNLTGYKDMILSSSEMDESPMTIEDIHKLNYTMQFYEMQLLATLDYKEMVANMKNAKTEEESIALINDNLDMTIGYTDGTVIATGEAFYDAEAKDPINFQLVFKDESKATIEAYYEENLKGLQTQLEALFEE